jgi:protein involved in polysaccharide export with SLBB domain
MKTTSLKISVLFSGLLILISVVAAHAQTPETQTTKKVNFGYSQNPKTNPKKENTNQKPPETPRNSEAPQQVVENNNSTNETIAQKTLAVVKNANKKAPALTESYKVGAGDILFINLQNSSKGSTYFTVLNDGTIDYPLAGEMVSVAGLTTEEIEDILREKVKLYENPQVAVKVREYSSHKITVLGLVEKSGDKFIQREAVPLFVVRAEAIVQTNANRVVIRRADSSVEAFSLKDEKSENTLIFPNDIIEFTSDESAASKKGRVRFFFIGGEVGSAGQKDFYEGMTLTQAILASGGLKKDGVKKVVVRRKNAEGLLVSTEYNLKLIKDGRVPDPVLEAGDTLEIGN